MLEFMPPTPPPPRLVREPSDLAADPPLAEAPPDPEAPAESMTLTAFKAISVAHALATWERLRDGYEDKSGQGYLVAIRTSSGSKSTSAINKSRKQQSP